MPFDPMFRFTIRDLLWLMVVVGLSAAWWVEQRGTMQKLAVAREDLQKQRAKPSRIYVGDKTASVQRKQRMLVSIDEAGSVEFRQISKSDMQKINQP
jgi:hypothetical protein